MEIALGRTEGQPFVAGAVAPTAPERNDLRTRADWERARAACVADPGAFHGEIARREIHWYAREVGRHGAWIRWDEVSGTWSGNDARTGEPVVPHLPANYAPWSKTSN